jgi:4'-phosphopantetheinyl transferase
MSGCDPYPKPFPGLVGDAVHVWKSELDLSEPEVSERLAILSETEQRRAEQFKVERPRTQFIVARSTLRILLGNYLNTDPQSIVFETSEHGKPQLENAGSQIEFNVSHSHNLALFVFCLRHPVGIDVEWLGRKVSHADIARRFFSLGEREQLDRFPEQERHDAFLECWTRKEAYMKARGFGLSRDPRTYSVLFSPPDNAALLEDQHDPTAPGAWAITALRPREEYCAALCCRAPLNPGDLICHW